jgi:hypothetical protein
MNVSPLNWYTVQKLIVAVVNTVYLCRIRIPDSTISSQNRYANCITPFPFPISYSRRYPRTTRSSITIVSSERSKHQTPHNHDWTISPVVFPISISFLVLELCIYILEWSWCEFMEWKLELLNLKALIAYAWYLLFLNYSYLPVPDTSNERVVHNIL